MQKWEYLVIRGQAYAGSGFRPYSVNGQVLNDKRKASLVSLMNQLGDDGWELVCSTCYTSSDTYSELLFKRPKP